MPVSSSMENDLALSAVCATEAAALAAARFMGRGDERAADQAAVEAMRLALDRIPIAGEIVIGEGQPDEAAMLFVGEAVGRGGPRADIALDPLQGVTLTAKGGPSAISVIALAEKGGFLRTPDVYMNKIAVGGGLPADVVDLDQEPGKNLKSLARARGVDVGDLVVCVLDRPRHAEILAKIREAGSRVMLISDGDVSGVVAVARADSGVDMYLGCGGAREGVLAAAALRGCGGRMQGRLLLRNDDEKAKATRMGIVDLNRKYSETDLAGGDVIFAATGVTDGSILRGVRRTAGGAVTHSVVTLASTGTTRLIEARHDFARASGGRADTR